VHQACDIQPFPLAGTLASSSTHSNAQRRQIWRRGEKAARWVMVPGAQRVPLLQ
jgi:hypothetical protein